MGYDTAFSMSVTNVPGMPPLSVDYLSKIADEINDMFEQVDLSETSLSAFLYGRWYEWEEDMRRVSRNYPIALFTMEGDGEDSDDFWRFYILNGAMQGGAAVLVYPELDLENLCMEADIDMELTNPPPIQPGGDLSLLIGVPVDKEATDSG